MTLGKFQKTAISLWVVAMILIAGLTLAAGTPITFTGTAVLLLVGCVPPVLLLRIFRGAPAPTIAQVLYDEEHRSQVALRLRQIPAARESNESGT